MVSGASPCFPLMHEPAAVGSGRKLSSSARCTAAEAGIHFADAANRFDSGAWMLTPAPGQAPTEGKGLMSSSKRQQTMAKIRREQAVKERRAQKQLKKEAARSAKAGESTSSDTGGDDHT